MSKSFDVKVSFNFRTVVSSGEVERLEQSLAELRDRNPNTQKAYTCSEEAFLAAYANGGIEAALEFFVKDSVKQMKELILNEAPKKNFKNFSPFHAEITPRG